MLLRSIIKVFAVILCLSICTVGSAQSDVDKSDRDLVHAAVEDYVLALYNVEPERIALSVDTSLRKLGYYQYNGEDYFNQPMTYDQLYTLSETWNQKGNQADENSIKDIEIYEVHDKTAAAKLTAVWGIDFMQLYKKDGKWKIINIVWQSEPK